MEGIPFETAGAAEDQRRNYSFGSCSSPDSSVLALASVANRNSLREVAVFQNLIASARAGRLRRATAHSTRFRHLSSAGPPLHQRSRFSLFSSLAAQAAINTRLFPGARRPRAR